ncbi:molybdopterin biosynthesis protein [Salisediminibacterium halotolerans]|uniref:molybdopterin biosynthesis protein n=1 Tax=Salisediminibacterium halotolerans TaxID=517425 RepID=UPI000EB5777A|nr:molybdopterin biosynthesis protein [Salisediminibacterium halotolerans]RLJ80877.1 molybdopterin molybdochelatase [Actinophytocola xinjiangensis]RPE83937.1 molybdopterin molybdochelatase [Salisediminibacterium halotolerans]TWG37821.1 molybdopterin molybdochelatase [Salisediminibacterium halotolerans]GEL09052.1 LysR family transcriptional regulator [Salisediminibacterium halotolerans]
MKRKQERTIYLQDKPRMEALEECLELFKDRRSSERIPVQNAAGRVTAAPVFASASNPHFHASAMDGIAVNAAKTETAHESAPLRFTENEDFVYVDTGHAIPASFDAVIMIEHINETDISPGEIEIIEPAVPWQHIRPIGEDVTYGEMILPAKHQIRPIDTGAMLAAQIDEVDVMRTPNVAIFPSGSELISPAETPELGKLIEFNGTIFSGLIKQWGGNPHLHPIVKDDKETIRKALADGAAAADIVIINAGSSAGAKDYTREMIAELGTVLTHGIATRPGKPVIIGEIKDTPVIGVPGYPVSAYFVMDWFVRPLLFAQQGLPVPDKETLQVKAGRRMTSSMGSEDFIRVNIGKAGNTYIANPMTRSASVTMSLVKADGIVIIPAEKLGIEQGETVEAELMRPLNEIDRAVLFSGSHDLSIDVLSALLRERTTPPLSVSASHTGSMAGIMAVRRGEAHLTGIHLLDPQSGDYNLPYLHKYLNGMTIVRIPFLKRLQGLIVPQGNPNNIQSLKDLAAKKIHYINRQKGAGTRVLFDHLLKKEGISPDEITGYGREMYTHLSVAAEVASRSDAAGMGIFSAADAMQCEFIPVSEESYDLIMTAEFFEQTEGQFIYEILKSSAFKERVENLGGYTVKHEAEAERLTF